MATKTYNSAVGASSPVDGRIFRFMGNYLYGESLATLRAAAGTTAEDATSVVSVALWQSYYSGFHTLRRGIMCFDTSAIGAGALIRKVTLQLYGHSKANDLLSNSEGGISIVSATPANTNALVVGDYNTLGTTRYATDIAYNSIAIGSYNTLTFNSTGIAAISKTGITKIGMALAVDTDNGSPLDDEANKYCSVMFKSADAGSSVRPILTVWYYNDLGLSYRKGGVTKKIGVDTLDGHTVRVRIAGATYGIEQLATGDALASDVRMRVGGVTKAWPLYP